MPKRSGVPAKVGSERGNSVAAGARITAHRVRAMLDTVLDEMERERTKGKRDWCKRLVDDFHDSPHPLVWLQQFREAAGVKDIEQPQGLNGVVGATLAGIFAGAAAQAASSAQPEPVDVDVVDVTPEPVAERVQDGCSDDEVVDW